jgi:hypothetical protein
MVDFDDFKKYLPQYLSATSLDGMFEDIQKFVQTGSSEEVYTSGLKDQDQIFQGDALNELPFITFPHDSAPFNCKAIVLSNSCDINPENPRPFNSHLIYSPIWRLSAYIELLTKKGINEEKLINHIIDIKSQVVTQILYLPQHHDGPNEDCIVFLDRICHCDCAYIDHENIRDRRLFSFGNFGFYLFLLKISIHFTRIREKIDRDKGEILS